MRSEIHSTSAFVLLLATEWSGFAVAGLSALLLVIGAIAGIRRMAERPPDNR